MRDHPLFGTGLGTFPKVKHRYSTELVLDFSVAHNTYVQLGAEVGLPMLGAFILLNLYLGWSLFRARPPDDGSESARRLLWLRAGCLAGLPVTWLQMTKGDMGHMDFLWWLYAICFACLALCRAAIAAPVRPPAAQPSARPAAVSRRVPRAPTVGQRGPCASSRPSRGT
jgi:O-antigen ligase